MWLLARVRVRVPEREEFEYFGLPRVPLLTFFADFVLRLLEVFLDTLRVGERTGVRESRLVLFTPNVRVFCVDGECLCEEEEDERL